VPHFLSRRWIKCNRFITSFFFVKILIERCRNAGLQEPEFYLTDGFVTIMRRRPELALNAVSGQSTPQVTPPVVVLLRLLDSCGALSNTEIRKGLGLKDRKHVGERYLEPALAEGLVELTIPDKPKSSLQKYRLTSKGKALIDAMVTEGEMS
jgi:ATP-dependent DNA helicase RecG